jgi:hypothetical protein
VDKIKTLSLGERIIAIAAIVLFIDGFLPWYKVGVSAKVSSVTLFSVHASRNGWQSPGALWSFLAILVGLAMLAVIAIRVFELASLPEKLGSLGWGLVTFIAGAATLLFVILKWVNEHSYLSYGFWIGLVCTLALTAGGYLAAAERGELPPVGNTRPAAGPGPGPAEPPV